MSLKLNKHMLLVLAVLLMLVVIPISFAEDVDDVNVVGVNNQSAVDVVKESAVDDVEKISSDDSSEVLGIDDTEIEIKPNTASVSDYVPGDSKSVSFSINLGDSVDEDDFYYCDNLLLVVNDGVGIETSLSPTSSSLVLNLNIIPTSSLHAGDNTVKLEFTDDSLSYLEQFYTITSSSMTVTVADSGSGSGEEPVDNAIYVDSNSGSGGSGTSADPYHSILTALSNAKTGEEIKFLEGTYDINQAISFSKNIQFTAVGEVIFKSSNSYMFTSSGTYSITFNGIRFAGNNNNGAAVYYARDQNKGTLNFNYCDFIQNNGNCLIYSSTNINIKGCNFIDNAATGTSTNSGQGLFFNYYGAGITIDISYSNFINNDIKASNNVIVYDWSNSPKINFNHNFIGSNTKIANNKIANSGTITNGDNTIIVGSVDGGVTVGDTANLNIKFVASDGSDLSDNMANLTVTLQPTIIADPIAATISNNLGVGQYVATTAGTESVGIKINDATVNTLTFEVEEITEGTLFVDENAASGGNGEKSTPYQTIKEALDNLGDNTAIIVLAGNYVLDNYNINKNVAITGRGKVTVSTTAAKHMTIAEGNEVNLTNLVFTGATTTAIESNGDLNIKSCLFEDNSGTNVVKSTGNLDISYSAFVNNDVSGNIVDKASGSIEYNFWGSNDVADIENYIILNLEMDDEIYAGGDYPVVLLFTDNNNGELANSLPDVSVSIESTLGTISPSDIAISSNTATVTYNSESSGGDEIKVKLNSVEITSKEFTVLDDDTSKIYVDANRGVDASGRGSKAKPYKTIKYAFSQAAAGNEISVNDGVYEEFSNSLTLNKNIKITAAGDNVILKGAGSTSIISASYSYNIELIGLTFINGGGSTSGVSGSSSSYPGSLKIINCTFANSTSSYNVIKSYVPTEITGCTFINNKITGYSNYNAYRGLIALSSEISTVNYNMFIDNTLTNANSLMIESFSGASVNINNNYWGTNDGLDSSKYSSSGVTYNNWVIMEINDIVDDVYVADELSLGVEFKSNDGSSLSGDLFNKHLTFDASCGGANPQTTSIKNNEITTTYTADEVGNENVVLNIEGIQLVNWEFEVSQLPEGTILVDVNKGNDATGDGSSSNPYKTIAAALDNIGNNNAILVKDGEYTLDNYVINQDVSIAGMGDVIIKTSTSFMTVNANVNLTNLVFDGATDGIDVSGDINILKCVFINNSGDYLINSTSGKLNVEYTIFVNNSVSESLFSGDDIVANYNFWGNNDKPEGLAIENWVIIDASIDDIVEGNLTAETNHELSIKFVDNNNDELTKQMHDFDADLSANIGIVDATATISNNVANTNYISNVEGKEEVNVSVNGNTLKTIAFNVTEREEGRIYVDALNGNDETGEGTKKNPYATITKALTDDYAGNEIILYTGTYTGYYVIKNDVTITGRGNPVIDLNGYYLNGYFSGTQPNIVLNNLVITNQTRQSIFQYVKDLTINNCTIENASAGSSIIDASGKVMISNSSFVNLYYLGSSTPIRYSGSIVIENSVFNNVTYGANFLLNGENAVIDGNFWGSNNPTKIVSSFYSDVLNNWAVVDASFDADTISGGDTPTLTVKFLLTSDGENFTELNSSLPATTFAISSLLGNTFAPETITLTNNIAEVTYNAVNYGEEVINLTAGNVLLKSFEFEVEEGANESVIFVDAINGNDTNGDGSKDKPYQSLETALNEITDVKNTISLKEGTYEISDYSINEDVLIRYSKQTAIILANNLTINANVVFDHLIFDGGDSIKLLENNNLTIINTTFTNSNGVVSSKGNLVIIDSKFINNTAGENGVISALNGSIDIKYSEFIANDGLIVYSEIEGDVNDNYWGSNNILNVSDIIKPDSWVALLIELSQDSFNASEIGTISFNFKNTTNGIDFTDLTRSMPDLTIDVGTEIGAVEPNELVIKDNSASVTYNATTEGAEKITFATENTVFDSREFNVGKSVEGKVFVATWGSDTTGDGSRLNPYATIQKAVNSAVRDNEITIFNGTYVVSDGYISIYKNLSFTGECEVIIKSELSGYYPYLFMVGGGYSATFTNIIFANASHTSEYASVIEGSSSSYNGYSAINVINCTFINNKGGYGPIHANYAYVDVSNSKFINNTATRNGQGSVVVYVQRGSLNITYSEFIANNYNYQYDVFTYRSDLGIDVDVNYNYWGSNDAPSIDANYPAQVPTYWVVLDFTMDNYDLAAGENATLTAEFKVTADGENYTALNAIMPTVTLDLNALLGETSKDLTIENNYASAVYNATTQGDEEISLSFGETALAEIFIYVDESTVGKIYVDEVNGNDTNDGTRKAPYATISKAIEDNVAKGGNWTIVVREGNYVLSNAEIKDNLTIKANDGVTISGDNGNVLTLTNASLTLINVNIIDAENAIVAGENTNLTIINSTFIGTNGAIISNGNTTVYRTVFQNNEGIVIKANAGEMNISYSEFIGNSGTLIESNATVVANNNFWGTNDKPTIENVTIDKWVIVQATFEEAPNIFIDRDYSIIINLINNDGSPLDEEIPLMELNVVTDLGNIESPVYTGGEEILINYNTADEGSSEINVTIGDDVLVSIPIVAVEDETGKIFVATNGSDENGNGSKANPYQTITKALDRNAELGGNQNIIVMEGTYETTSRYTISRNVQITGRGNVILTGESDYLFYLSGSYTLNLTGLTLKDFKSTSSSTKRMIYVYGSYSSLATLNIENCTLVNNNAQLVYAYYANANIKHSTIRDNNVGTSYLFEGYTWGSTYGTYTINYCNLINNTCGYYVVYARGNVDYNFWGANSNLPAVYSYATRNNWVVITPTIDETIYLGEEYWMDVEFKLSNGNNLEESMPTLVVDLSTVLGEIDSNVTISENVGGTYYTASQAGNETITLSVANKNVSALTFTVENPLSVTVEKINEGEKLNITVTMANGAEGTATVNINGTDYTIDLVDGYGSEIKETNLAPGTYDVTTAVGICEDVTPITIDLRPVNISFEIEDVTVGEKATIKVIVNPSMTSDITVYVNGKSYIATKENNYTFETDELETDGEHSVVAIFMGDEYHAVEVNSTTFNVNKLKVNVSIDCSEVVNGEVTIIVTLPSDATGTILIDVNGTVYAIDAQDTTTHKFVLASMNSNILRNVESADRTIIVAINSPGKYNISATYIGDNKYESAKSDVVTVEVPEAIEPEVNVNITDDAKVGEDSAVNVTLPDDATGNVTVKVDGKEVANQELVNGNVVIPLDDLTVGNHTVEISYDGDDKYSPTTVTKEL